MSLRWRIMGATILVIFLTILASIGVGYYATQHRLGVFVDQITTDEASQLARDLSREYTASNGWDTAETPLSRAGYLYEWVSQEEQTRDMEHGGEGEGESSEFFHTDLVRIVIVDLDGIVVRDNLSELSPGGAAPDLGGHRETVVDLNRNQAVGHLYVDVEHEFLSSESHGFLSALLYITVIGGTLTAGVAILLAAWLSRRITAPVTALTAATREVAEGSSTLLPVVSGDELGQMSAAFNRMTSTLETQRELRRRVINDLSHELNTPLSVIQLEATGLRDGLQEPGAAAGHIIQEVGRLRGLVSDLNLLAETDHGEFGLTLKPGSVLDLLADETGRWRPECRARQVELLLETTGNLPDLEMDRMRMGQALGNVIRNAIQHTRAGGSIVIRAESDDGGGVVISVTDDGTGIDAADLPHLFDRFYRTERSRSEGMAGTGLGLAIARATMEAHGGTITAASDGPGQGAIITCRLPLKV